MDTFKSVFPHLLAFFLILLGTWLRIRGYADVGKELMIGGFAAFQVPAMQLITERYKQYKDSKEEQSCSSSPVK